MLAFKSKPKASTPPANPARNLTPAVEFEQRRIADAMRTDFVYEGHPTLGAARVRLAALRAELRQTGERSTQLRDKLEETRAAMLAVETAIALGTGKPADLVKASAAYQAAQSEAAAYRPGGASLRQEVKNVEALVEQLEKEEEAANKARLLPIYRELVAELDAALEKARVASDKLRALKVAGRNVSKYWPGAWSELSETLAVGVRNETALEGWRKQARAMGLLD